MDPHFDLSPPISLEADHFDFSYPFSDVEGYVDAAASESQSSVQSPKYDLPYYGIDIDAQFHPGTLGLKEEDELSQATQEKKPAAKRKRENRYKNAAPAVLSRRREQNRASQRAYRQRKDQRISALEEKLTKAEAEKATLATKYIMLYNECKQLTRSRLEDQAAGNLASTASIDAAYGYPDVGNGYVPRAPDPAGRLIHPG